MKVAVVDHIGNFGGSSRVIRALLPAMKKLQPDLEMSYFGNPGSMAREGLNEEFTKAGIETYSLKSAFLISKDLFGFKASRSIIRRIRLKFEKQLLPWPVFISGAFHREVEMVCHGFDIVYFPWPFYINCPRLSCPMVGTFHDFNFKYYFNGPPTFAPEELRLLNREIPRWLKYATPVVSTFFMAGELKKFYPDFAERVRIVHLAPMSGLSDVSANEAEKVVAGMGINTPYVLYPTNVTNHKNIGPLLAAMRKLIDRGHKIALIVTGPGTDAINGRACEIGIELGAGRRDVIGLGYVNNLQMDSLIQCASVVVTTSLYEAGNGPGVDAWVKGVPVAMSNIPAFIEHLEVQDVRAETFDPRSPQDIADKISHVLSNPEKAKRDANHSKNAIQQFTWLQTAEKYLEVFNEAIWSYSRN